MYIRLILYCVYLDEATRVENALGHSTNSNARWDARLFSGHCMLNVACVAVTQQVINTPRWDVTSPQDGLLSTNISRRRQHHLGSRVWMMKWIVFWRMWTETNPHSHFFRDNSEKWPQLSKVEKNVLCVMPSPANAERAFSKAPFSTESRKNKLSCESIKTRLIASCD